MVEFWINLIQNARSQIVKVSVECSENQAVKARQIAQFLQSKNLISFDHISEEIVFRWFLNNQQIILVLQSQADQIPQEIWKRCRNQNQQQRLLLSMEIRKKNRIGQVAQSLNKQPVNEQENEEAMVFIQQDILNNQKQSQPQNSRSRSRSKKSSRKAKQNIKIEDLNQSPSTQNQKNNRKPERLISEVYNIMNGCIQELKENKKSKNLLQLREKLCQRLGESRSTIYGYERHLFKMGIQWLFDLKPHQKEKIGKVYKYNNQIKNSIEYAIKNFKSNQQESFHDMALKTLKRDLEYIGHKNCCLNKIDLSQKDKKTIIDIINKIVKKKDKHQVVKSQTDQEEIQPTFQQLNGKESKKIKEGNDEVYQSDQDQGQFSEQEPQLSQMNKIKNEQSLEPLDKQLHQVNQPKNAAINQKQDIKSQSNALFLQQQ